MNNGVDHLSKKKKDITILIFQKVAGSIPHVVLEFLIDINPSDRTMALGSTQPLTEMSTRCISWGVKAAGA
jgi:hypothetical protein